MMGEGRSAGSLSSPRCSQSAQVWKLEAGKSLKAMGSS